MADDDRWMAEALVEADAAASAGDVPVGCVIVDTDGQEIGRGHNGNRRLSDPTAHAEIVAIRLTAASTGPWRLRGATVYVTLEPCAMCAGAFVLSRIGRLVFGCADPKAGAVTTMFGIGLDTRLNHRFSVSGGLLQQACAERLRRFFAELRAHDRAGVPPQGPS